MGKAVVEPGAGAMKPGARALGRNVRWLKIGARAGKPRTKAVESGARTVALAACAAQAVESATYGEWILVTEPWLRR